MALMICPECDKQISDKAKYCPNCGFPLNLEKVVWKIENDRQKEQERPGLITSLDKLKSGNKNLSKKNYTSDLKDTGLTLVSWILFIAIVILIIAINRYDNKSDNKSDNYVNNSLTQKKTGVSDIKLKYSTNTLNVREKPNAKSKVLKTFKLNERVLTFNDLRDEYIMVLNQDSLFFGWASVKYLQDSPLSKSQIEKAEKKKEEVQEAQQNAWKKKIDKTMALVMAREFVEKSLKSPGSAKYPWESPEGVTTYLGNQVYIVKSYVDSQNGFGALIRTNFIVKVEQTSKDYWSLLDIEFY